MDDLEPGEELLWQGHPRRRLLHGSLLRALIFVFVTGVGAAVIALALWMNGPTTALLWTGSGVAANAFATIADWRARQRMTFYITTRRAIVCGALWGNDHSVSLSDINVIRKGRRILAFQAKDHRWFQISDPAGVFPSFDASPAEGSLAFVSLDDIDKAERIAKSQL
jgi:hypothetical protein